MAFLPVIEHARDCAVSALNGPVGLVFLPLPTHSLRCGLYSRALRGDISPLRSAVRNRAGLERRLARPAVKLMVSLVICSLLLVLSSLSCSKRQSPQQAYDHTYQLFLQGTWTDDRAEARVGTRFTGESSPGWQQSLPIWRRSACFGRALSGSAHNLLQRESFVRRPDSRIFALSLEALPILTYATLMTRMSDFSKPRLCAWDNLLVLRKRQGGCGMLSIQEDHLDTAEKEFSDGLALARPGRDRFTEATAELEPWLVALRQSASMRRRTALRKRFAIGCCRAREIAAEVPWQTKPGI